MTERPEVTENGGGEGGEGPSLPAAERAAGPSGEDVSITMERANLVGLLVLPIIAVLVLVPFWVIHGWGPLREGFGVVFNLWFFIPAFLLAIVIHEGLHGLGFLLVARAPREKIHFGIDRATYSPYAGCRAPISAATYRVAVALPALALGVAPLVAGYVLGWGAAVWWALVMLVAAAGDLIVLWAIREVPGDRMVLDHPTRVGCVVLEAAEEVRG